MIASCRTLVDLSDTRPALHGRVPSSRGIWLTFSDYLFSANQKHPVPGLGIQQTRPEQYLRYHRKSTPVPTTVPLLLTVNHKGAKMTTCEEITRTVEGVQRVAVFVDVEVCIVTAALIRRNKQFVVMAQYHNINVNHRCDAERRDVQIV